MSNGNHNIKVPLATSDPTITDPYLDDAPKEYIDFTIYRNSQVLPFSHRTIVWEKLASRWCFHLISVWSCILLYRKQYSTASWRLRSQCKCGLSRVPLDYKWLGSLMLTSKTFETALYKVGHALESDYNHLQPWMRQWRLIAAMDLILIFMALGFLLITLMTPITKRDTLFQKGPE